MELGGLATDSGHDCTHIVAPRVSRTVKFLSGISSCDHIVTPEWVEESGRRGAFVAEEDFFLRDSDAEQLFGMNLTTSLSFAKERKLLEGISIVSTPSVQPPADALREIVTCAGGSLLTLPEVKVVFPDASKLPKTLIVLSTPEDIQQGSCKDFTDQNISESLGMRYFFIKTTIMSFAEVYNAELILTGVLKQKLDFSQHHFQLDVKN